MIFRHSKQLLILSSILVGINAGLAQEPIPTSGVDAYTSDLARRIKRACFPPSMSENKRTIIDLKIGQDGHLISQTVCRSSGTASFDQSCRKAVENSAPFRHLFSGASDPISIQIIFDDVNNKISCKAQVSNLSSAPSNHHLATRDTFESLSYTLQLNPANYDALMSRGMLRAKEKDYDGAIDDFSKVIKLQPSIKEAYFYRSGVKTLMGDSKGSAADMDKYWSLGGTWGKN